MKLRAKYPSVESILFNLSPLDSDIRVKNDPAQLREPGNLPFLFYPFLTIFRFIGCIYTHEFYIYIYIHSPSANSTRVIENSVIPYTRNLRRYILRGYILFRERVENISIHMRFNYGIVKRTYDYDCTTTTTTTFSSNL